ncbi:hypothetical protein LTR62_006326 [Meristemomyces frigidus]|uniref:AB hydrolase-1 domain-containing protein n=1 Tax=Meristemomyces frigidus TaxID=1508187 RepID=A0AAN7TBX4_9PEZI|nr:hypothetical protein LTR62_006326 [Meristemomyces frigidus]
MAEGRIAGERSTESLAYTELNEEQAASVIFIHGAAVSGQDWLPVAKRMPNYHILLPDLPSHGKSATIKPFTNQLSAQLLADLIRKHAHNGNSHVVALSLGAFVAVELATTYPDVVLDMFISGLKCLAPNLATGIGPYVAYSSGRFEDAVPRPLVRWLMDGTDIQSTETSTSSVERTRAILTAISRPEYIPPWGARTCIIAAGKRGILPTADTPADAIRYRDAGKGGNAETVAFTLPQMRHPWNNQDPELFARAVLCWLERRRLPGGFVEM